MAATYRARVVAYTDQELVDAIAELAAENRLSASQTAEFVLRHGIERLKETDIPITRIGP